MAGRAGSEEAFTVHTGTYHTQGPPPAGPFYSKYGLPRPGYILSKPSASHADFLRFVAPGQKAIRSYSRDCFEAATQQYSHHSRPVTCVVENHRAVISADEGGLVAAWNFKTGGTFWRRQLTGGDAIVCMWAIGAVLVTLVAPASVDKPGTDTKRAQPNSGGGELGGGDGADGHTGGYLPSPASGGAAALASLAKAFW